MTYAQVLNPSLRFSINFRGLIKRFYYSLFTKRQDKQEDDTYNDNGLVPLIISDAVELIAELKYCEYPYPKRDSLLSELDQIDENRYEFALKLIDTAVNLAWANGKRTVATSDDVRKAYQTIQEGKK